MNTMSFPVTMDVAHRRFIVGGEPMIFHCHHYNVFLQRTLLDAQFIDTRPLMVEAAATVARAQLSTLFHDGAVAGVAARAAMAAELYRFAGFGTIDLSATTATGGEVRTDSSHYATGWLSRFGRSDCPVCFFAQGFVAGAIEAIHELPEGAIEVRHPTCMACGGDACVFVASAAGARHTRIASPGIGTLTDHRVRPVDCPNVDYEGILAAVSGLPLVGNARGEIPAFGVMLTRHYANYYNLVSFELLRRVVADYGDEGRAAVTGPLVEAGRVCAFNTFGGIMTSTEWNALIRPRLRTREDWVHGIVAVANALGWGRWQVVEVSEDEGRFVIHDDYESVGYLAAYGRADGPVSFLAEGGVSGVMSLVYDADIASAPTLDPAFYSSIFRRDRAYRARTVASRALGDEVTEFVVTRS